MPVEKIICPSAGSPREALKIGVFAGLHGDEPAGTLACHELVAWARSNPPGSTGYELHFYPVCNPSGCAAGTRHSGAGLDLNREFWRGSQQPEIMWLEAELRRENYDGIIALHSDDTTDGCYGFVSGLLLSESILAPALAAASSVLPLNLHSVIDGFPAANGIIKEGYDGVLKAPPNQRPGALEIVFETPALTPVDLQVRATILAVQTILAEYRQLLALAQNI